MTCPTCGEPVATGDAWCEACGDALAPAGGSASGGAGPGESPGRPSDASTCPTCDAPGEEATADGYCGRCGRRWSPVREHDELTAGPIAAVTDRGIAHWRNEDAAGIAWSSTGFALVVSDGVSASQEPQMASQAAVDAAIPVLQEALAGGTPLETAVVDATAAAQKAAAELPFDDRAELGPGACTLVVAIVRDGTLVVGTVGDSRAYWVDGAGVVQLGQDDSLAAELVASGRVSARDAVAGVAGHTITKWLGVDSIDPTPSLTRLELPGSGLVVAVTDGLWNYAPEADDLERLIGPPGGEPALALARRLVAFAEGSGGADNVTVAVGPYDLGPVEEDA